jgi:hypothetical protein
VAALLRIYLTHASVDAAALDDACALVRRVLQQCTPTDNESLEQPGGEWAPLTLIDSLLALMRTRIASTPASKDGRRKALVDAESTMRSLLDSYLAYNTLIN